MVTRGSSWDTVARGSIGLVMAMSMCLTVYWILDLLLTDEQLRYAEMYAGELVLYVTVVPLILVIAFSVKGKRKPHHRGYSKPAAVHPDVPNHEVNATTASTKKKISRLLIFGVVFTTTGLAAYSYALVPFYRDLRPRDKLLVRLVLHPLVVECGEGPSIR